MSPWICCSIDLVWRERPSLIFTQAGSIEVTVTAQNIPNGTEIRLRVTTPNGVISAGPELLNAGSAQFTLVVPAGTGTVQGFADYRTSNLAIPALTKRTSGPSDGPFFCVPWLAFFPPSR